MRGRRSPGRRPVRHAAQEARLNADARRDARKTREWASVPHGASRRISRNRARGSRASAAAPGLFACLASIGLHLRKALLASLHAAARTMHLYAARRRPIAPLSSPGEPHRHRQDPGRPKPHGPTIPIPPPDRTTPRGQRILAARQKPHVPIQPRVEPHRDQEHGPPVAGQPLVRACPNAISLRHPIPSTQAPAPGPTLPNRRSLGPRPRTCDTGSSHGAMRRIRYNETAMRRRSAPAASSLSRHQAHACQTQRIRSPHQIRRARAADHRQPKTVPPTNRPSLQQRLRDEYCSTRHRRDSNQRHAAPPRGRPTTSAASPRALPHQPVEVTPDMRGLRRRVGQRDRPVERLARGLLAAEQQQQRPAHPEEMEVAR